MANLGNLIVTGAARFLNEIQGKIDWSNILNKPTIPSAANNGQLTIQKNGTTVQTFTANQSTNVTANITVPTVTDSYSSTGTDATSGKAVAAALGTLDGTISGTAGASKTLTALSQTDGKVSATFADISISKSQISDFPTIPAAVAVKGNAESSYRTGNVNLTPANLGAVATSDVTNTYSATGTSPITGTGVAAALGTLDVTTSGAGASKTLTALSQTDGKISATFGNISITKSQISDFPSLGTAAAKNYTTSVTSGSSDLVTSGAVYTAIDNLPEPMIFKGSLGTGGTITTLPTASSSNTGWTYKVIADGTYDGQAAKIGDLFISDGSTWVYIPSADEPSGTVTSVGISNGGGLSVSGSPVTTSGTITISHADTSSQASVNNSGRTYIQDITLDTYGHVTGIASATETVVNTDRYVNSASFADNTSADASNPVKMTLTRAGSDTATVTANIPKISSSSAGVVPKGTAVSSQSQSTKFLREDGSWAAPSYTTNTNTTYTLSAGTGTDANKIILTPSSGTANKVKVTTTAIGSASAGTAISADDITAWTTNTPTSVTANTVVTGGTTTSIPNISKKTVVTSATASSASVSGSTLTISNGSVTTGDSVTVGTAINAYTSLTTGKACSVTNGTAASLSYTSRSIPNISVTSTTVATGVSADS